MIGLQGCRILVVEDDALVALDLEMMLQGAGCEVIGPVARLDQAKLVALEEKFNGALLDIHLRGEVVYPVADILITREVPFMFLSGYSYRDLPHRFSTRPLYSKPYTKQLLIKFSEVVVNGNAA